MPTPILILAIGIQLLVFFTSFWYALEFLQGIAKNGMLTLADLGRFAAALVLGILGTLAVFALHVTITLGSY